MNRIVAMIGLPRSGKSTKAMAWQKEKDPNGLSRVVISRDWTRLALHGKRFDPTQEGSVDKIYRNMIKVLLTNPDLLICLDETNCSIKSVRLILKEYDVDAKFMFVDTPVNVCIDRAKMCGQDDLIPVIPNMMKGLYSLADYCNEPKVFLCHRVMASVEKIRQEVKNAQDRV